METAPCKESVVDSVPYGRFIRHIAAHKFGDPVTPAVKAIESFLNCEILHRRAERAAAMKLPKGEEYEKMAMVHNAQGLRRLKAARASVNKAIEMYPRTLKKEDESVSEEKLKEIFGECDVMFKNEIFEKDLPAAEAAVVWSEYEKVREVVTTKRMRGLADYYGSKIDELTEARTDLAKGRKHASPICEYKIAAIVVALVITAAAVAYCYLKDDCEYLMVILEVVALGVYKIVRQGC